MENHVPQQLTAYLTAAALGAASAMVYDLLRTVRLRRRRDRQLQHKIRPRVHRRAGAHALVKDCGLAPLDVIAAHEADDGGIPAQLLPDRGQLPRVAEMEGVIFTDHADRLHKRPSDKKILGNSCFPFAFVV